MTQNNDAIEKILSRLIAVAAKLIRGEGLPSSYREDHVHNIPSWVLKELGRAHSSNCNLGNEIKTCIDALRSLAAADPLRAALGPEAEAAIIEGRAVVAPLDWLEGLVSYAGNPADPMGEINSQRLDKPTTKDSLAVGTLSKTETVAENATVHDKPHEYSRAGNIPQESPENAEMLPSGNIKKGGGEDDDAGADERQHEDFLQPRSAGY